MKKDMFIIMIMAMAMMVFQAVPGQGATSAHGFAVWVGAGGGGQLQGAEICMNATKGLSNVTKYSLDTSGGAYIYQTNGDLIATELFTGATADFTADEIILNDTECYIVEGLTDTLFAFSAAMLPVQDGDITWVSSVYQPVLDLPFIYDPAYVYTIESIGYEDAVFENETCEDVWAPDYGVCTNSTQLLTYHDINSCDEYDELPGDNGTYVSCSAASQQPAIDPLTRVGLSLLGIAVLFYGMMNLLGSFSSKSQGQGWVMAAAEMVLGLIIVLMIISGV